MQSRVSHPRPAHLRDVRVEALDTHYVQLPFGLRGARVDCPAHRSARPFDMYVAH